MDGLLLADRLVLAAVLLVAAVGKLADRRGSRNAVEAFGVPTTLAGVVAALVPVAELLAAALLVPIATARAGAAVAVALFAIFTAAIAVALARGERPDCHCFGQLHSSPAGPGTLGRNVVLTGLAALPVAAGPGMSATAWLGDLSRSEAFLAAGVALALSAAIASAALSFALLRRHGRLLLRIDALEHRLAEEGIELHASVEEGLPVGDPAPLDVLPGLGTILESGRDALLVFTRPDCGPCRTLEPAIEAWKTNDARLAVVTVGGEADLEDVDGTAFDAFGISGTPGAVVVHADGTIGSPVAFGPDAVSALHDEAIVAASRPRPGDPLPELDLRGLDGEPVAIGADTTVLLWNPDCGFCAELRDGVRAAEERGASLVVVSSGDPQATLAERFRSPVALDPEFALGDALYAGGTPTAVRVRGGRLAAEPAVGVDQVRSLLGS